jgi:hypothetical protein
MGRALGNPLDFLAALDREGRIMGATSWRTTVDFAFNIMVVAGAWR